MIEGLKKIAWKSRKS